MTWAVIGAGYTGIAITAALLDAGLDVELLDRRPVVGGLWVDGTYDSVRLITSRKVTAFDGRPLPDGPTFPTGPELLAYLTATAASTGALDRFRGQNQVLSVSPESGSWAVATATSHTSYDGVVLATGLFQVPRIPLLPGVLNIPQLHTSAYRHPGQLGDDVLVVGLGNSGADVAQDAVAAGKRVTLAVNRGRHVVPRRVLGSPIIEMRRPALLPELPMRLGLDALVRLSSWRSGALPSPRHLVLAESPVVHSALLPLVASRKVSVRTAVKALCGDEVAFSDGSTEGFDTVVWATGYDYDLPVDRAHLDAGRGGYRSAPPRLVGGAWSPVSRGLAAVGHREPRGGRGPYLSALAGLVAAGARAQAWVDEPVGRRLADTIGPTASVFVDNAPEIRALRLLTAAANRLARPPA